MRNKDKVTVIFDQQLKRSEIMRGESVRKRSERLKSLRNWVINNRDRIKSAIYNDFKKPPEETDVTEVSTILLEINHALKYLNRWSTPEKVSSHITYLGTQAYVQFEPKGVCLIIAPWNYPFFLAISPLISAIAAGNTAIIKPSEMTVNTSNLISQMISELYPEDLVTVFEGGVDVSQALLALPFNHIFFTGSTQVGKIVMEAAAKNLSSVTLEL